MKSHVSKLLHPLFRHYELRPGLYRIEEQFFDSWNKANMYFAQGPDSDLLIDTGGLAQFHGTDEPVITWVHGAERQGLAQGISATTAAWIMPYEVTPKPSQSWRARDYRVEPTLSSEVIEEGSVISLGGGREFEVLHLPGHTSGSVALFDRGHGMLATGDTLYYTDEELIDWYPGSNSSHMKQSVERILQLVQKRQVDILLPGHNQALEDSKEIEQQCCKYLSSDRQRKRLSRLRASCILWLNGMFPLPDVARDWMKK